MVSALRAAHPQVPVGFDTDVNAPALAEFKLGVCKGSDATSCAYVTVGTGVGIGLVVNSGCVHGLLHPEGGHMNVRRLKDDDFAGTCPFHADCVEGLCATGALSARANVIADDLATLDDDHPVWDHCSYALAAMCANLILIASPEKIVLGGGVMSRKSLFPRIRTHVKNILKEYVRHPMLKENIDDYIVPPTWEGDAGLVGAFTLAKQALEQ